jgi:toxin YoeB
MSAAQKRGRIIFTQAAWQDYEFWQGQDRKTLRRINALIRDAQRNPFQGIGKPEPLKASLAGFWSRRIDEAHRLVYAIDDSDLIIVQCRYHY